MVGGYRLVQKSLAVYESWPRYDVLVRVFFFFPSNLCVAGVTSTAGRGSCFGDLVIKDPMFTLSRTIDWYKKTPLIGSVLAEILETPPK
jgi:hypothetical protein